jgi:lipid II:glycine glycyltransferase (peptidoglycan interpeptide bridge formation enzyme)
MLEFFEYQEQDRADWDDFVINHPLGSVHQITAWRDFQVQIPGRDQVYGFGVKKNGQIMATTWCVKMDTGRMGKYWFYSARGPVTNDLVVAEFLIEHTQKTLTERGGIFWRFDPYWESSIWAKLKHLKLKPASQQYQPTDTLEIDLTLSEEDILAQMKQRGRRGIKTANKAHIQIETITAKTLTEKDLNDWWSLNQDTTGRDGFSGHEKSYYEKFLRTLDKESVLFFANYQDQRICAAISTFVGDKAIYYFGASTSDRELNKLKAPTLLQWAMMKHAKAQGCKTYDFLGIAPENEPKHAYAGITQFKNGFGGYRKTYGPGRELPLDNWWYLIYKVIKKIR